MEDVGITLDSITKTKTIKLGIKSTYCSNWSPMEAFREIVQNWRDAIISSFQLTEAQFKLEHEVITHEQYIEILYKVPNPEEKEPKCLGYIRYCHCAGRGFIDITNCNASLEPQHLDLGGTSKGKTDNQVGIHGDGLKVALTVLQRHKHVVSCLSGGLHWDFGFDRRGSLFARLCPLTPEQASSIDESNTYMVKKKVLPYAPSLTKDVQFTITMNPDGKHGIISPKTFSWWCQSTLFLVRGRGHENFVPTPYGDLIINTEYCGMFYLKGFSAQISEIGSPSITGLPLAYGYHFASGSFDRDRRIFQNSLDEWRAIRNILDWVELNTPGYHKGYFNDCFSFDTDCAEAELSRMHDNHSNISLSSLF